MSVTMMVVGNYMIIMWSSCGVGRMTVMMINGMRVILMGVGRG